MCEIVMTLTARVICLYEMRINDPDGCPQHKPVSESSITYSSPESVALCTGFLLVPIVYATNLSSSSSSSELEIFDSSPYSSCTKRSICPNTYSLAD